MKTFRNLSILFCIISFVVSIYDLQLHGLVMSLVFGLAAWGLNWNIKREVKQFAK